MTNQAKKDEWEDELDDKMSKPVEFGGYGIGSSRGDTWDFVAIKSFIRKTIESVRVEDRQKCLKAAESQNATKMVIDAIKYA